MLRFIVHDFEPLRAGGEQPFAQRGQIPHHDRQRRAQLVGDVSRHLAAQEISACQVSAHLVERGGHLPDLVAAAHRNLLLQVAAGYRLDGCRNLAQGFGQRSRKYHAEHERKRDRAAHGNQQQLVDPVQIGFFKSAAVRPAIIGKYVSHRLAADYDGIGVAEIRLRYALAWRETLARDDHHTILVEEHEPDRTRRGVGRVSAGSLRGGGRDREAPVRDLHVVPRAVKLIVGCHVGDEAGSFLLDDITIELCCREALDKNRHNDHTRQPGDEQGQGEFRSQR